MEGAPRPREGEEQGFRTVAAAAGRRHTAGSTDNRRRSSGIHRRRRKDQHHSIGRHTGRHSLRHFQLQRRPGQSGWLMRREIAGYDRRDGRSHHILRGHRHRGIGHHDRHGHRGHRRIHRICAVGDYPCGSGKPVGRC